MSAGRVKVKGRRVKCGACWRKPYRALTERAAEQIAEHHAESHGHRLRALGFAPGGAA